MIQIILKFLDKILGTLGERKTQKGFFVAAITAVLVKFFPDFPQEDWAKIVEFITLTLNSLGVVWGSFGVLHQWVKDQLLKANIIPASVKKLAEEGKTVLVVKPK